MCFSCNANPSILPGQYHHPTRGYHGHDRPESVLTTFNLLAVLTLDHCRSGCFRNNSLLLLWLFFWLPLPLAFFLLTVTRSCMIPINMSQVTIRLNDVPHPPLQLLGLGEPTIYLAIPEYLLSCCNCSRAGAGGF